MLHLPIALRTFSLGLYCFKAFTFCFVDTLEMAGASSSSDSFPLLGMFIFHSKTTLFFFHHRTCLKLLIFVSLDCLFGTIDFDDGDCIVISTFHSLSFWIDWCPLMIKENICFNYSLQKKKLRQ